MQLGLSAGVYNLVNAARRDTFLLDPHEVGHPYFWHVGHCQLLFRVREHARAGLVADVRARELLAEPVFAFFRIRL